MPPVNPGGSVPDRLFMVVPGLDYASARQAATLAATLARENAPKLTGASARRIMPFYGEGFFGIRWMDCVALGTRVLTADWRWVPVESLVEGDALIGFDEESPTGLGNGQNRGRRYRTSHVQAIQIAKRRCVEIEFDDGTVVVNTANHPWLARKYDGGKRHWIRSEDLKPGDTLGVYFNVWAEDRSYEAGWLAGMFDGEGCLGHNGTRSGASSWCSGALVVSQNPGPTHDRLCEVLTKMGFTFGVRGDRNHGMEVLGGFDEQVRLLGTIRPERLVSKIRHEGRPMKALRERQVIRVTDVGLRRVVLMSTSTKTYMADGMAAHNSYLYYQEGGVRPFVMTHLAGKTIPMWIDDPTGTVRQKYPKAQTRTTESGKTQVLIFRKAAQIGARKMVRRKVAGTMQSVSVPMSYPGAPGRISLREAPRPFTTEGKVGGRIAAGNSGVRWRFPGIDPRGFLQHGVEEAAKAMKLGGHVFTARESKVA